jgi:hypothetical protein
MRVKADGTSIVHIDDPAAAVTLGRYRMGAVEYGQAVAPLAPLDANAAAEFVVLGEHFGTDMLEIHDSADGQPLRYFYLP